ncbi:MAG: bifunctional [glutamine synthetase] adenylyltransferase/[glutamine synthetase]-adenylyl-L-tyrosine phosphorylase [Candidatus Puniceispirillaceae bacterium]
MASRPSFDMLDDMKTPPSHQPDAKRPDAKRIVIGPALPLDAHAAILPDIMEWASPYLGDHPTEIGNLAAFLAHSRHLQQLARACPEIIAPILDGDAGTVVGAAVAEAENAAATLEDEAAMMAAIRRLRRHSALAVALSDMAGSTSVTDQMTWLSMAADAAVRAAVMFLFRQADRRGQLARTACLDHPELAGCGWTVLALGKLGAGELNYSSDIDLILLHDPIDNPLSSPEASQTFYVEMTRALVRMLSEVTADGIGWRVDLRLRPDPGATAVSIQREAALGYYESIARTWERAAFIRARPVAGDKDMGRRFLDDIRPFIWRRTLDYTVMDDMKVMLRPPMAAPGWEGFNLKTGPNGIRSIEFLTHVLQLVGGGRSAALRQGSTLPALAALTRDRWISEEQRDRLGTLYLELRRTEHRLQMLADAQTHALPRSMAAIAETARFMGHESEEGFLAALTSVLAEVGRQTSHRLFAETPRPEGNGSFTAGDGGSLPSQQDEEQLTAWIADHGFARPADIAATLAGWLAGRIAATRGERARTLLARIMPDMLAHLATAADPDAAFASFAGFVEGLPASVQIFSLLDHNRELTRLLGDILVLSPRLAATLRRHPMLFDLVMFRDFFAALSDADSFEAELRDSIAGLPLEAALEATTRLARERRFRAEVQGLSAVADRHAVSRSLADTAEAVIRVIRDLAITDMQRRHGAIDGDMAVIAMGRLGTRGLTATSDLDLVFVWQAADSAESAGTESGGRSLGATAYFTRLAQTMASWLGGATGEGDLYSIDTRLRPDGEKGSFAPSLARLADYYQKEAWQWERLALAKARLVTPRAVMGMKVNAVIAGVLDRPVPVSEMAGALYDMRDRLRAGYGDAPAWQIRRRPGGMTEHDLLVQGLRMVHADLFSGGGQPVGEILDRLREAGRLEPEDAAALGDAASLFTALHHALRLVLGTSAQHPDSLSAAARQFVLDACDSPDQTQLEARIDAQLRTVDLLFERLLPRA